MEVSCCVGGLHSEREQFIEVAFSFKAGTSRDAMAYNFRKAKKGELFLEISGTFSWVRFCPSAASSTDPQP